MLTLKNICVSFGKKKVLRDLCCHIQPGDFIVIVGTNGAGKSTFFDTISGKQKPDNGAILLNGTDITHTTEQERSKHIARLFQSTHLNSIGSLTVMHNLLLAQSKGQCARLRDYKHALTQSEAEKILQSLELPTSLLSSTMNDLSGGQRQRIAFAMATQKATPLLLLDEPTAALDPKASTRLLEHAACFIKKNKVTTLLITHDPHIALSLGNKIWVLDQGTIVKRYTADEKKNLNPENLIGHIDYARLQTWN